MRADTIRLLLKAPEPLPAPVMAWRHLGKLTTVGPMGLLPAAGPVEAQGWREQASGLVQGARLGPAHSWATGAGRSPRDCPPGWHKGH
jgi:hypothetical protein